jgi:hypothetical protein
MGTRDANFRCVPRTLNSRSLALRVWVLALACLIAAGCGVPGEPQTRRPPVAAAITDLAARQTGSAVALTFTLPKKTLAGEPLSEPPAIEIYRGFAAPEFKGKAPDLRLAFSIPSAIVADYLREGHMEFVDPIPPEELASHPGQAVVYIVRTRASRKRASADSNAAVLRVYPVPAGIHDARANVTETAIELSWSAPAQAPQGASIVGYRVYRAEVDPASVGDAAKEASQARLQAPLTLLASSSAASYRDTQFEFGKAYLYSIRSVVTAESATLESGDSNPLRVTPKDVFPPAPPQGLVAVVVPATPEAPPYVELSWGISSETDWAGYYVYRSDKEGAPGERLTPESLPVPTFRDISVVSGRRYFYRVTAVDRAGNESAPSAVAAAELPQPSP